nr:MAG TPA: hypothetical protein [Caudoviricetes sp.]
MYHDLLVTRRSAARSNSSSLERPFFSMSSLWG